MKGLTSSPLLHQSYSIIYPNPSSFSMCTCGSSYAEKTVSLSIYISTIIIHSIYTPPSPPHQSFTTCKTSTNIPHLTLPFSLSQTSSTTRSHHSKTSLLFLSHIDKDIHAYFTIPISLTVHIIVLVYLSTL